MATITWKNPVSGDWNAAANWSTDTVPTFGDDVTISVPGDYTVTVSSDDQANSLLVDGRQLIATAGSLSIAGELTVIGFVLLLNEANPIESVAVDGGFLAFGNPAALGSGTVSMDPGGELLASYKRNSHQRALIFWNFDDRRRAWNNAQRRREQLCHQRGFNPEYRRAGRRRNDSLADQLQDHHRHPRHN